MIQKKISSEAAIALIKDHHTVMVGGFLQCGHPVTLTETLVQKSTAKDLTIISSDTGNDQLPLAELMLQGRVKKVYASYIGANSQTSNMRIENPDSVELVPQGTLAERIRAGGAGLGGILTPVGVGTIVEENKQMMTIEGKKYLLELPLKADVALVYADEADEFGNLRMLGTTKNFNEVMATAADCVIAQVKRIIPGGNMPRENIHVPGIYVHWLVEVKDEQ